MNKKYMIFADESMTDIIFVLNFFIINEDIYKQFIKTFIEFKFRFWEHDAVNLHSNEINSKSGFFQFLTDKVKQKRFYEELNNIISELEFKLITTVIDVKAHKKKYKDPIDCYELSLCFCLERLEKLINEHKAETTRQIIFESRGKQDLKLQKAFRNSRFHEQFELIFASQKNCCIGLELADLTAYPITKKFSKQDHSHKKDFEIIEKKFRSYPSHNGRGLKLFP